MARAHLFDTPLGTCGIVWTGSRVSAFALPVEPSDALAERLGGPTASTARTEQPPRWIATVEARICRHLSGDPDPLLDVPVDLGRLPPFRRLACEAARHVGPGRTASYGEIAALCGRPGAARAVGGAMAGNPIPLLVPCHRLLGSAGSLTGFSAHGGLAAKLRLLTIEGADLGALASGGVAHLRRADARLASVIRRVGPYRLAREQRTDHFTALVESIVHQQVSMAAGRTVFRRLRERAGAGDRLEPERVLALSPQDLRSVGVSRQKASYLADLAGRTVAGALPLGRLGRTDDEGVIETLTAVRGIGRWSAEMFLMFRLGRLDVLPVDDLGLRKGAQLVYGLSELPTGPRLRQLALSWEPFRSIATWYLWRALETERPDQSDGPRPRQG